MSRRQPRSSNGEKCGVIGAVWGLGKMKIGHHETLVMGLDSFEESKKISFELNDKLMR